MPEEVKGKDWSVEGKQRIIEGLTEGYKEDGHEE